MFSNIISIIKANSKRFFRDKTALFFTFLLPLIFLFIFGSIFKNDNLSFNITIINQSNSSFSNDFIDQIKHNSDKTLKIIPTKNLEDAKKQLKRSKINAIILIPENFNNLKEYHFSNKPIEVIYTQNNAEVGSIIGSILNHFIVNINLKLGYQEPPIKITNSPLNENAVSSQDYTLTGIFIFSIISLGIFGVATLIPADKSRGIFRRFRATPLKKSHLLLATTIFYTMISLTSFTLMVVSAMLLFNFKMRGDWLLLILFIIPSALMINGIGMAIGSWANNEKQASAIANIVANPIMFLSGVFIPIAIFPNWLQYFGKIIPTYYVVDGIRLIMAENANINAILPQLGIITISTIVIYLIAIKLFRWEDL